MLICFVTGVALLSSASAEAGARFRFAPNVYPLRDEGQRYPRPYSQPSYPQVKTPAPGAGVPSKRMPERYLKNGRWFYTGNPVWVYWYPRHGGWVYFDRDGRPHVYVE